MANQNFKNQSNNYTLGIILIVIGGIILVKKLGFILPVWLFSWPVIFLCVGLVILINSQFKSGAGYFFLIFGSFFLLKKYVDLPYGFEGYVIALGLIGAGLYFLANQKRNIPNTFDSKGQVFGSPFTGGGFGNQGSSTVDAEAEEVKFDGAAFEPEIITSQAFLSGDQKRILSKNFRGGKISAILGGSEIDLSQADLTEPAMLNVEVALGGIKLLVPPHWNVQVNVSNVLAGIEDKRMFSNVSPDPKKVLKIYGSVVLGGLEIKSF
ncbi:cell wall-active antibiotics response protein [Belliella sp. DSM 111904]|uniref:Cell wall-active antibiotics response protein n=1 Tax=Belliella filtrata TaxID=2923435 RepID=A0ABS9UYW4_9BACT|nr:LiaF domain-containing protein [Belliella filtrata]MCH7409140.1 cell wall-active antibiotics response protein [Belliella filtrata]